MAAPSREHSAAEAAQTGARDAWPEAAGPAVAVRGLTTRLGGQTIHRDLDLEVRRGEVMGLVGGSGSGKSVLLRAIIGLLPIARGRVEILGLPARSRDREAQAALRRRTGVLFQEGALFSSLTVAQNVALPLREFTELPASIIEEAVRVKLALVGLEPEAAVKLPEALSGGMVKRAALARALALDPELLFLDEPTAGLDPVSAERFDALIRQLQEALGLTVLMATHDLSSLVAICDRVAALIDRRAVVDRLDRLARIDNPWIRSYFWGPRGRALIERLSEGGDAEPDDRN